MCMKKKLFLLCVLVTVVGCNQVVSSTTSTPNPTTTTATTTTVAPTIQQTSTVKPTTTTPTSVVDSTISSTVTTMPPVVTTGKLYNAKIKNNIPEGYYESCRGLKGEALKNALHEIIKGHTVISYSKTTDLFKDIDKDPRDSSKLYFIYTGLTSNYTTFDKEHVWAKSHGSFENIDPMHSDLHNLHPCFANLNSTRGNKHFAEGGDEITTYPGNKQTPETFEPSDFSKGDTARTIFYMAVRYEGNGESDLELSSPSSTNYYDFSNGATGLHGRFDDLYKWAVSGQDPVDDYEVSRNNIIYENHQKNRNPFIDHPEFIKMIYDKSYDGPGALLEDNPHDRKPSEEAEEFIAMVNSIDETNINSQGALQEALELYELMSDEAKELAKDAYETLLTKIQVNQAAIDELYINQVIEKINQIGEVTLEDKELIEEAEELYDQLSDEAKAKVTNYETLVSARAKYDELYKQAIQPFEFIFAQASGGKNAYETDLTMTLGDKSFFASHAYKNSKSFRLGYKEAVTAPAKFTSAIAGIKSSSSSLEALFDITGLKITIETAASYKGLDNMHLLKSTDGGTTYQLVGTQPATANASISFDITPGKARYAIVIDGSQPRLDITSLKVS